MILTADQKISKYPKLFWENIDSKYLNENYLSILDTYNKNGFGVSKFMFDRTGTIEHYLNVTNSHKVSNITPTYNFSFNETVEKRCKELLSLGKRINVSWSGGIDSTFVLFALYHYAEDKDQIQVYGTYNSIIESGYLFDRYIKDRIKYKITTNPLKKLTYICPDDEIFVTGGMGNQLFYFDTAYSNTRDACLKFKDPSKTIAEMADEPVEKVLEESNYEFYYPAIKNSPRKIETLQDMRWFVSFNFTWNSVFYNSFIQTENHNKIHHFFGSQDFQDWSLVTKEPATKIGDYSDERWHLREAITEYTGETLYSKQKVNALSVLSKPDHNWFFLLDDYSNVLLDDLQIPTSVSYK